MRLLPLMVGLLLPMALPAQATDSLPFRAGQWGAEFSASHGFGGIGLMRFSSPGRAWFFNVQAGYTASGSDEEPPLSTQFGESDSQGGSASVRLGHRWFRPAGARVVQQLTLGIDVGGAHSSRDAAVDSLRAFDLVQGNRSLGAFAEVGAAWMVTPKLALGAAYGMGARYFSSDADNVRLRHVGSGGPVYDLARQRVSGFDAYLGQFSLRAALYF